VVRAQFPFHPLVEGYDLVRFYQGIKAQHGPFVSYLAEFVQGGGTDALCRGIGGDQLRVCLFEVGQFSEQPIIFSIGNLRAVLDVIEVVVMPDLVLELSKSLLLGTSGSRRGRRVVIE
jgi:hypothetical protein